MKLTDLQRKQIIAEYVAGDGKVSQRSLAKKYHVSQKTISTILSDEKTTQKVSQKKKENEISMLAFLDARAYKAQNLIDKILDTLPQDFEKASMRDKAGLLKILSETFAGQKQEQDGTVEIVINRKVIDLSKDKKNDANTIRSDNTE